ncbi:APC family permease [Kitasatospora sp. NPDC058218]|uniref:APC family permease n=1 Tax=Kitasatospora sp. NPDC058218 TaxID=3346385 RepID=UPI0036DF10D4
MVSSPPPQPAGPPRPAVEALPRSLGVFGGVLLTLSCVTPASSLFIVVPPLLMSQGSGAVISLLLAAVLSLGVGLCYAELGTLVPSAGGEYSIVGQVLGRLAGWLVFMISIVSLLVIPPIIALGTADYLGSVLSLDPAVAGAAVMALAVAVGVLDIKSNALITGVFLGLEVLAAGIVAVLGFTHVHQPVSSLVHAVVPDGQGGTGPFTLGLLISGLAVAMFTYNGFGTAVYLSEDLRDPRRSVARTVLWSLLAGVVVITVPVVAICLGVDSPDRLAAGDLIAIVDSWAGSTVGTFVSLCIAAAILNAVIVMVIQNGRVLYASARDRTWPDPVNRALGTLHPRWGSPWVATLAIGAPGAVLALTVPIDALLGFTGVVVAVIYLLLGVAALLARRGRHRGAAAWRMPLWPVAPVLTTVVLGYALTRQAGRDLLITLAVLLVGVLYWFLYLRPRSATHWVLSLPADQADQADAVRTGAGGHGPADRTPASATATAPENS